jgi:hypothetical protein
VPESSQDSREPWLTTWASWRRAYSSSQPARSTCRTTVRGGADSVGVASSTLLVRTLCSSVHSPYPPLQDASDCQCKQDAVCVQSIFAYLYQVPYQLSHLPCAIKPDSARQFTRCCACDSPSLAVERPRTLARSLEHMRLLLPLRSNLIQVGSIECSDRIVHPLPSDARLRGIVSLSPLEQRASTHETEPATLVLQSRLTFTGELVKPNMSFGRPSSKKPPISVQSKDTGSRGTDQLTI